MTPRRGFRRLGNIWVSEETALTVAAFYRGVMYLSGTLAKLPIYIKDFENNILWDHDVGYLLNLQPNQEIGAMDMKLVAFQEAIVRGNFYAEISRDMLGRPRAIWPFYRGECTPERLPSGELVYRIRRAEKTYLLEPRNVLHIKNLHRTQDGLSGMGLVAYALTTLSISQGADAMASGIFGNSGLPSGFIKHPKTLSDEAYARLEKSFSEENGGSNAGGVKILEEGAEFVPLEIDAQVLQFLESRKFSVLECARFLGLPPHKLYDTASSTFSNTENANLEVINDTIDTWAASIQNEIDIKLLSRQNRGYYSYFDIHSANRGDMATRGEYFTKLTNLGALSPNEIREKESMPGYSGGERRYIASNNLTPVDRVDEIIDAEIEAKKSKASAQNPETPERPVGDEEDDGSAELNRAVAKLLSSEEK